MASYLLKIAPSGGMLARNINSGGLYETKYIEAAEIPLMWFTMCIFAFYGLVR